jgi:hypothetical protein
METMYLVAGLAVAGLAGVAAAFYFSIRSGNRRDKRLRSAGAGRAGTGRRPGSRSISARPDPAGRPRRTDTGGRPVTTFTPAAVSSGKSRAEELVTASGPGDWQAPPEDAWPGEAQVADSWPDDSWPQDPWLDDPVPGDPATTDPKLGADGGGSRAARPRRRVGFRKGADLDEELWPAETFGGVSDEQFWDDLASDKPLATTARVAQQDSPGKNRSPGGAPGTGLDTGPATEPKAVQARADDGKRDDRTPGRGRRGSGSGAYAGPRTGPDPAAERTAIQPAYAATQPVQAMTSQLPGATQPVRAAASNSQPMSVSRPGTGGQQAETRRRRPSSAEEDPLTSAAFSLRPSGPVDGRSSLRARNTSADRYDTQTMATPPYGQDYGYGKPDPAAQAGEPRRHNGTGSHARPDSAGEGTRSARQTHPRHSFQPTGSYPVNGGRQSSGGYPASGSYPVTGSYPASGGYPGTAQRGNGHRAPYDPRDDYRRLTHQH